MTTAEIFADGLDLLSLEERGEKGGEEGKAAIVIALGFPARLFDTSGIKVTMAFWGDEGGGLDDAILSSSCEGFARKRKQRLIGAIFDVELGEMAFVMDLADLGFAFGEGFGEGQDLAMGWVVAKQGNKRERFVMLCICTG